MNRRVLWVGLAALLAGLGGGYWLAKRSTDAGPVASKAVVERKPLFYRHPMNPAVTSELPATDEMGMAYVPVYADEQTPPPVSEGRKILHYRNPMDPGDISPVPKRDAMGMDYVPVFEDKAAAGQISLSPEKIQKLGVRTDKVIRRVMSHTVRAVGVVQVDERRVVTVQPKFGGWVERLAVSATGDPVRRGQTLLEVYSPEVVSAEEEYRIADSAVNPLPQGEGRVRGENNIPGDSPPSPQPAPWGRGGKDQAVLAKLAESALNRLRLWDVPESVIQSLVARKEVRRLTPVISAVDGVVLDKPVVRGMRFQPGELLYRLADLSSVWFLADIFERDLPFVTPGHPVDIRFNAYPERDFQGLVSFIYPTVSSDTRTAKARIELSNRDGLLKPAMYGNVELQVHFSHQPEIVAPDSAIIDSGERQLALVTRGEGTFEPRKVRVGRRSEGYVEILEGLSEGETVVVQANFLIDAESNLKAALRSFGAAGGAVLDSASPGPIPAPHQGEH